MGDEYRAGQRRESRVHLVGFGRTSLVSALESRLQQDAHILGFEQADLADEVVYSHPADLADRYSALLSAEEVPVLSPAESGLVELFNAQAGEDVVVGAALMAGAAFLRDVFKVQGMDIFSQRPYSGVVLHLLDLRKLADFGSKNEDPASRLMSQWILERQDALPEVLAA